jgi:biopolymer transport protein TolR
MPQVMHDIGGRSAKHTSSSLSEINIVPLVDVVLVLLIIFMITAPVLQSGIEVKLPKTKTVKDITETRLVVTLDRSQRVYLNDQPVNIHDLGADIKAKAGETSKAVVYVRCDETVPFGSFTTVVDTLRQSGVQTVNVVTQPLSERAIIR